MIKKNSFVIFLVCFITFGLTSCSADNKKRIGVFYNNYKDDGSINSLREKLDVRFSRNTKISFENYNAESKQKTQTDQIEKEIQDECKMLLVNMADASDREEAKHIVDLARNAEVPVLFFGTGVDEESLQKYDKALHIGAEKGSAGKVQGQMIGNYLINNYDIIDTNDDGIISYVMLKGAEDDEEAALRTEYSVEEIDRLLSKAGKPAVEYYDKNSFKKHFAPDSEKWSFDGAYAYVKQVLESYNDTKSNMIELVIANNDDMALGAIKALQDIGYNNTKGNKMIPVFGIDATIGAQNAIYGGVMTGTVTQNPDYMAKIIEKVCENMISNKDKFQGIDKDIIEGRYKIYIPYEEYYGKNTM